MLSNALPRVAYFCMEYALQSDFKMYAGGLGILAGDYLKGAKDHKYPIVGIGINGNRGIQINAFPRQAKRSTLIPYTIIHS